MPLIDVRPLESIAETQTQAPTSRAESVCDDFPYLTRLFTNRPKCYEQ